MRLTSLLKPEYYLRPKQAIHRTFAGLFSNARSQTCILPSGLPICLSTNDELGKAIYASGVYDLCLTEALWRLINIGDTCVDVGANIGYASSIMSIRAGKNGKLYAFEAHPEIFKELKNNVQTWNKLNNNATIECFAIGVSDFNGQRALNIPPDFSTNRGMSHFYEKDEKPIISKGELIVPCITLDNFAVENNLNKIDLLKVDTEGHELQVLKSASKLLLEKRIKNIIFEDSRGSWRTPKELHQDYSFLRDFGYTIFRLKRGVFSLIIENIEEIKDDNLTVWKSWEPPNFVACLNSIDTKKKLKRFGWYSLLNRDFH